MRQAMQGVEQEDWRGKMRIGMAGKVGAVCTGVERLGLVRQAWKGSAGYIPVRLGSAWQARQDRLGEMSRVMVRRGWEQYGRLGRVSTVVES